MAGETPAGAVETRDDPVAGLMVTGGNMAFIALLAAAGPFDFPVPDWALALGAALVLGFTYMFYRGIRAMGANVLMSVIGTGVLSSLAALTGEVLGGDSPVGQGAIENIAQAGEGRTGPDSAPEGNDSSFAPVLTATSMPKPKQEALIRIDSNSVYDVRIDGSNLVPHPIGENRGQACENARTAVRMIHGSPPEVTVAPDCECDEYQIGGGRTSYGCNIGFSYFVRGEEQAKSARDYIDREIESVTRFQTGNGRSHRQYRLGSGLEMQ